MESQLPSVALAAAAHHLLAARDVPLGTIARTRRGARRGASRRVDAVAARAARLRRRSAGRVDLEVGGLFVPGKLEIIRQKRIS